MSDFAAMIEATNAAATRIDERAVLLVASRDFRVIGSPWRFIFSVPGRTLFFARAGHELQGPDVAEGVLPGFRPVPLPLGLSVEEAARKLDDFPPPYAEILLSFPLTWTADQPCYTFTKDGRVQVVGAADGRVIGEALPVV